MLVLSGADLVLPDRVTGPSTLVIDGERIVEIRRAPFPVDRDADYVDLHGRLIVPGFVDGHLHGIAGHDVFDGPGAVRAMAAVLPRYGVTAFSPTTVACSPASLRGVLDAVREARLAPDPTSARVLPAHLESSFLNPDFKGAQPGGCLRLPPRIDESGLAPRVPPRAVPAGDESFSADDILAEIQRARPDVGAITLAPELAGATAFIGALVAAGHRVSLGHSGATFDQAIEAIAAGASRGTHLFNRMPPLGHREPGLAGAIIGSEEAAAELICDGVHVHPAMIAMVVAAKGTGRVMAITDGTAGAGLPAGSTVRLGPQTITVRDRAAYLDDHTLAGSTLTLDRAFRLLAGPFGLTLVEAALLCATTPARELGLVGHGAIVEGHVADLVVLGPELEPERTYIGGRLAWENPASAVAV